MDESSKDRRRLQFDFSPESWKDLGVLKDKLGLDTYSDVVKQGLGLLHWLVNGLDGAKIILEKDGMQKIVIFPWEKRKENNEIGPQDELPITNVDDFLKNLFENE